MDSPERLTSLGRKERYNELNDISESRQLEKHEQRIRDLEELRAFDTTQLDKQTKLSWLLYKHQLTENIEGEKWRHYSYPINQMFGFHSGFPSFMINKHLVTNEQDALDYLDRLSKFEIKLRQTIENLRIRAEKDIIIPDFVFAHFYSDCKNIIGDKNSLADNIFINDLEDKLDTVSIAQETKNEIIDRAKSIIKESVIPAYEELVEYIHELEEFTTHTAGVWRFKDGDEFYQYRLKRITTTDMTPDEVFDLGISEVARIQEEMKVIMKFVDFDGDLQAFFSFMREDDQFYFPETEAGKASMLEGYMAILDKMEAALDEFFITKPKARMIVKAVEPYREKSAGKAFYQSPAEDGSRPGIYYANLYKLKDMPKYEMEALSFHEGIPGHHMQNSIAREIEGLPEFRKYSHYTAYGEGWGLYCEYLGKEMGFYQDPYSDFGRLAMEIWRACRLVVDAGMHHKKWTREDAIKYLKDNTPASENQCVKAIERYIVMPGQATAYKIGMIRILKIRREAEEKLGDRFDIREFHDVFLLSGPVPLSVFEERIDEWVAGKLGESL